MAYIASSLRHAVAERAGHYCEYCQSRELITGGPFHVEHIVPITQGGATAPDNLAYACAVAICVRGNGLASVTQ